MDKLQPVAWMQVHYKDGTPTKFSKVQTWEDDIPLYTHPADITDEEISFLIPNIFYMDGSYSQNLYDDAMKFARTILRKASEK